MLVLLRYEGGHKFEAIGRFVGVNPRCQCSWENPDIVSNHCRPDRCPVRA